MWLKRCSSLGSGASRRQRTHSVLIFRSVCIFLVSERIWLRSSWTAQCCSLHLMLIADKNGTKWGQQRRRKRKRKWVGRWNSSHPAALHFLLLCPVTHRRGRDQKSNKMEAWSDSTKSTSCSWPRTMLMEGRCLIFSCSLPPSPLGVKLQDGLELMTGEEGVCNQRQLWSWARQHSPLWWVNTAIQWAKKKDCHGDVYSKMKRRESSSVGGQMWRH